MRLQENFSFLLVFFFKKKNVINPWGGYIEKHEIVTFGLTQMART